MEKFNTTDKTQPFVKVPNKVGTDEEGKLIDPLVYANLRRFENKNTHEAFPSIGTIEKLSGIDHRTVQDSLFRMRGKYLDWRSDGKKRVYTFNSQLDPYEIFSLEFLDMENLTPHEKAYLMKLQQFMFKDTKNIGKVVMSTVALAEKLHLEESAIRRYDRSLQSKGFLDVTKTRKVDPETGAFITKRRYSMKLLKQTVVWAFERRKELLNKEKIYIRKVKKDHGQSSDVMHKERRTYKYPDISVIL